MRSLLIDQRSIHFLTSAQWDAMRRIALLAPSIWKARKMSCVNGTPSP